MAQHWKSTGAPACLVRGLASPETWIGAPTQLETGMNGANGADRAAGASCLPLTGTVGGAADGRGEPAGCPLNPQRPRQPGAIGSYFREWAGVSAWRAGLAVWHGGLNSGNSSATPTRTHAKRVPYHI